MFKKRIFLALIAVSMSLAGCGKNKTNEPAQETPQQEELPPSGDNGGNNGNNDNGNTGGEDTPVTYVVTFDVQGHGVAPQSQTVEKDSKVSKPQDPTAEGWNFEGWYKEAGCVTEWSFLFDRVSANLTLYAKWTEADYLTPEQRDNATGSEMLIKAVLSLNYEQEEIESCNSYILAYSEEIALAGANISGIFNKLMGLDLNNFNFDANTIMGLLESLQKDELLDDTAYFAVAAGKSVLRVQESKDEENGAAYKYAADLLDKEGIKVHENASELINTLFDAALLVSSEAFIADLNAIYESNQINFEKLSVVISTLDLALAKVSSSYESVSYFANLIVDGLVEYSKENKLLDDETLEELEKTDTQEIVDGLFSAIDEIRTYLPYISGNDSVGAYIVSLVNLVLAENFAGLAAKLFTDYMGLIGVAKEDYMQGLSALFASVIVIPNAFKVLSEQLSASFFDEEEGMYSLEKLQGIFSTSGEAIEALSEACNSLIAFDNFLMLVVSNSLITLCNYSSEDAEKVAAQLDISMPLYFLSYALSEIGKEVGSFDDNILELVVDIANEDYEAALAKVLDLLGITEVVESISADLDAIEGKALEIYGHFASDEFAEKLYGLVDGETGEVDLAKLKALLVEISDTLMPFLEVQENVASASEILVELLKAVAQLEGATEEEAEALFADFDGEEFAENLFGGLDSFFGLINSIGSTDTYDLYLNEVKKALDVMLSEDASSDEILYAVIEATCAMLSSYFEVDSEKMYNLEMALKAPVAIKTMVVSMSSSESSIFDKVLLVDEYTGKVSIDESGLNDLTSGVALLALLTRSLLDYYVGAVDVIEEIVAKVNGTYDPEAEEDPESIYAQAKAVIEMVQEKLYEVYAFLSDSTKVDPIISDIAKYGNLALEINYLLNYFAEYGYVDAYSFISVLEKLSEYIPICETEYIKTDSLEGLDPVIASFIDIDEIEAAKEEGDTHGFEGRELTYISEIEKLEGEDEGYVISLYRIESYEVSVVEGDITLVDIRYHVTTVYLPSLEFIALDIYAILSNLYGAKEAVSPYIDMVGAAFMEFYAMYNENLGEDGERIPEIEFIKVLFDDDAALIKALVEDVSAILPDLFSAFVGGDIDFSMMIYSSVIYGYFFSIPELPEESYKSFKAALVDVYNIASASGYLEAFLETLAPYFGEEVESIESGADFADFIYDLLLNPYGDYLLD